MDPHSAPPWILIGFLLVTACFLPLAPTPIPRRIRAPTPAHKLLSRGTVRELMSIDSLGPLRAQALVAARGPHGELPPLEEVPGIGPKTAATIRAHQERSANWTE